MKKDKVKYIINGNALIKGELCKNGRYCILGALLHNVGISDEELKNRDVPERDQQKILEERYGIDQVMADQMMVINDNSKNTEERRRKLLEFVDGVED